LTLIHIPVGFVIFVVAYSVSVAIAGLLMWALTKPFRIVTNKTFRLGVKTRDELLQERDKVVHP
jgi:hypothetical protein